jgi:putative ABC transport system permease protein
LILTGMLSGIYPALILSSFPPVEILKRKATIRENIFIRKLFLGIQITLVLLVGIFANTLYRQVQFMLKSDPGFDKRNIMVVQIPETESDSAACINLKNNLLNSSGIIDVSLAGFGTVPGTENGKDIIQLPSGGERENKIVNIFGIDENYIGILGLKLVAGHNFSANNPAEFKDGVLVNERFVRTQNWKDPVGRHLYYGNEEKTVIGVVNDFHFASFHNPIEPVVLKYHGAGFQKMLVKTARPEAALVEKYWKKYFPGKVFEYTYLAPFFESQYDRDVRISGLFLSFSGLALFIAAMGLLALCLVILKKKKKDIGIRIVFGADRRNIFSMVLGDFTWVIIISAITAIPLAWYSINAWFTNFAYHIGVDLFKYLLPVIIVFTVIALILAFSVWRIINEKPVEALRE